MEIGDSFTVPLDKYGAVRTAARSWGRSLGQTFTVRKYTDEHGKVVVRVWRLKRKRK
jgi:hypothetical protein